MKTPTVKEKGFVVVDTQRRKAHIVTDASNVARLIGKTSRSITNWFTPGVSMVVKGSWIIVKGYEIVKSERGQKPKTIQELSDVQETGDF